ncbi:MAG TPA: hypothetical protein VGW38_07270, partial [Chloroflexota bacterium]|nr:hypothetical protein [Chloroflexota bacterium]
NSLGQVYEKAWRGYADLVAREAVSLQEQGDRTHGHIEINGDERWKGWFLRITARVLVDEKREALAQRRGMGERAWNRAHEDASLGDDLPSPSASKWETLDMDQVVDECELGCPEVAHDAAEARVIIRTALRQMDRPGAELLWRWISGVPDRQIARERGISLSELRRQRAQALSHLSTLVRRQGRIDIHRVWGD